MVDNASYYQFRNQRSVGHKQQDTVLRDENLWMTNAYVLGFSLTQKQWGRFDVSAISNIAFQKRAFDQLVLDSTKKNLVRALVSDNNSGFSDIISGKGGGCIFLLHGEPGVGKTRTAEAVSELLERPLYMVSVGELGINSGELEKNLRQILDVAQIWNAVILIDEADIFLEKRASGDVVRNSLVSVFLRLLEYHQGVMFLTTNRVADFDPAFHSRISIAMHYSSLDQTARRQVWQNLLQAAQVENIDYDLLSGYPLNGRQIKNTIRLAQGLARQEGVAVNQGHFMTCIDLGQQFDEQRRDKQ
jgi:SpoVK/Ycf46/Vps4 family AAA+-type ATPase